MHNIVMLGPQGSGKGTQGELLSARLGIPAISTGRLFRAEIERKTGLGRAISEYVERGDIVPADIVIQAIEERISEDDALKGFILDGYPRTVEQAEALTEIMKRAGRDLTDAISIAISDEEAIRRLSGRRVCSNKSCEASYHVEFAPPQKVADKCDRCDSPLVQREDDTPEVIKHRLELYHTDTEPVIGYYRESGLLREINGEQEINKVEETIAATLGL
jgi:adenylate kinase